MASEEKFDKDIENIKFQLQNEIIKLIEYAKKEKLLKDVDSYAVSYAIWCFCRGYNADAVGRKLPKEEAVKNFKYSFGFLLDGLRA